jgi:hypothetical protein
VAGVWRTASFCLYAIEYKLYPHLFFSDLEVFDLGNGTSSMHFPRTLYHLNSTFEYKY